MNIWDNLPKPFFVLAPMDDVTDTVFRRIVGSCAAPDIYFTEFVNVDGLQSKGREKLLHRLAHTNSEHPLIAQIWGKTPENYYKTAQQLSDGTLQQELAWHQNKITEAGILHGDALQGFSGVDINFGCPVKAVIKDGCCVAMMNNRELVAEIIQATQEGASAGQRTLPVSVKTRLGYNEVDLTWHELLLGLKLDALTIHGRTKAQMSKVPADWSVIGAIRELRDKLSPTTKIIGNGDVLSRQQGLELAAQYGLDGIMIGRGIFNDPYVFAGNSPWPTMTRQQKMNLYKQHVELFDEVWPGNNRRLPVLNKFCKIYISGFDGAKELREKLMSASSASELVKILTAS